VKYSPVHSLEDCEGEEAECDSDWLLKVGISEDSTDHWKKAAVALNPVFEAGEQSHCQNTEAK